MEKYELDKLRNLPIEGVAERLGLRVSRHKALCPFHDDRHPSLSFNQRKNSYRCFVCGACGGTIDLVMHRLGLDFREACRWLADEHNIIVEEWKDVARTKKEGRAFDASRYERFFVRPHLGEGARRFLFEERMIDRRVVNWCRLSSWTDKTGNEWLQIPYFDQEGRLIGIQNRNLKRGALPRFRFPAESRCTIYNLKVIPMLAPGEPLYITEGCSDCWAMLSSGHKAVAIPSATLLNPDDARFITAVAEEHPIRMYPDNDTPGEQLFLRLRQLVPTLEHLNLPPGCKDYSDCYIEQKRKEEAADGKGAGCKSAGDESAGGESAGGESAGGKGAGGESAGGVNAGGKSAGGESAGGESAGGKSAGGENAGGEDYCDFHIEQKRKEEADDR